MVDANKKCSVCGCGSWRYAKKGDYSYCVSCGNRKTREEWANIQQQKEGA